MNHARILFSSPNQLQNQKICELVNHFVFTYLMVQGHLTLQAPYGYLHKTKSAVYLHHRSDVHTSTKHVLVNMQPVTSQCNSTVMS